MYLVGAVMYRTPWKLVFRVCSKMMSFHDGGASATHPYINILRLRQNGCYFANDIFKFIFLNENFWISIKISLKFVLKVPINNTLVLVQIMAWRRWGDKPLSEPRTISLLTHAYAIRPQWVKQLNVIWGNQPKVCVYGYDCLSMPRSRRWFN